MTIPTLRPYQQQGLDAIAEALGSHNRLLMKVPTGGGKTVMFASLLQHDAISGWLAQFPKRGAAMLVIAHREELINQATDKISRQNPGLMVSIEQGDKTSNRFSDVIVASVQTLAAMDYRRLKRLMNYHTFRIVVVDEAHHSAAATYRTILAHLGFLPMADASETGNIEAATHEDVVTMTAALEGWDAVSPKDRMLLGVTATPNRSDAIGLGCVFQTIAYSYALKQAIEDKWLVPLKPWVIETDTNLDDVKTTAGDFNQKQLAKAVNIQRRNILALDAWKLYAGHLSTIGFTVDIDHAEAMAELFSAEGIVARAISQQTPKDERRATLTDYQSGHVQAIFNCMVLTEGTDLPITGCILHLKPTKSATLYEQMTGRGLRLYPGKTECVVIDLVDVARRHSLQAAPVLYGLPPGIKTNGDDLRKTEDEYNALAERMSQEAIDHALATQRYTLDDLTRLASTFDVWTMPTSGGFFDGRLCKWMRAGEDLYRLTYPWGDGDETLQVGKDLLGHWEVIQTMTPRGGGMKRQRTMAAEIATSQLAGDIAEKFVTAERPTVLRIKSTADMPWKRDPATPAQRSLLDRLGVRYDAHITKEKASDLIDIAKARRGR